MPCRIAAIPARVCVSSRSSRSSCGTTVSKSGSYASDYSDVYSVSDTDGDDIDDSDEEFLRSVLQKCKCMVLAQFAMIPLVFTLAKIRCTRLVLAFMAVEILVSLIAQVQVRKEVADWVCEHVKDGWKQHVEALDSRRWFVGILPIRELLVYFATLSEAKDPAMDAWTAANSEQMCTATVREKFAAAWQPIPAVGCAIGAIGLPGMLLFFLCVATLGQMSSCFSKEGQISDRLHLIKQSFLMSDLHEAAHQRWRVWIYFSHLCDVGGLMLLHDIFLKLVNVEIDLSHRVWPVADRNAAFRDQLVDGNAFL